MRNVSKRLRLIISITLMSAAVLAGAGCAEKETMEQTMEETDVISPVIDQEGADPYVIRHGDWYYYMKTTGSNITLQRSESLTGISAGESRVLYEPSSELSDLWAPELFYLDDAWYVYFAARIPGEKMHFMYVLMNESGNPFEGEWICQPVKGMDDKFAIDGTVLELPAGRYFIWSGWEGYENVRQDIYLVEMVSPVEVKEEKILLSKPEYDWEMSGEPLVNEGPEVLIHKDTINLVYSASGSWTDDYCLGILTASADADVKSPDAWTKKQTPVMSKNSDVWGPGHNCFTVSLDGSETIVVYHAARWQSGGWSRSVRYGYAEFDESGRIKNMEPVSPDARVKLPSGERKRYVYNKEEIRLGEDIKIPKKGSAVIHVYVKADQFLDDQFVTSMELTVNGQTYNAPVYPSEYCQPVSFYAELPEEVNMLTVSSGSGAEDFVIDRIEIQCAD